MQINKIKGLVAAPFTPFKKDGAINLEIIGAYAEMLARNSVTGAFVCGSSGEGQSMSCAERMAVAETWMKEAPKSLKIIVHAGTNSIIDVKQLLVHAEKNGAYAGAILAPSYYKPHTVQMLADYIREAASAAPGLPLYFYHIPSMTGVNFNILKLLETLGDSVPNFAGIKYTYENIMDYSMCLEFKNRHYDMLFGRDELLLCALSLGAEGAVGSSFNYIPALYLKIIELFKKGEISKAAELQSRTHKMFHGLFSKGIPPLTAMKAGTKLIGIDCGDTRLPFPKLSQEDFNKIAEAIKSSGVEEYLCK